MAQAKPVPHKPWPADPGSAVVVAEVTNDDNTVVWNGLFSSHARAMAGLAAYCRAAWQEQQQEKPLPRSDRAAVTRFFEFWDPEMTWSMSTETVDDECPAEAKPCRETKTRKARG